MIQKWLAASLFLLLTIFGLQAQKTFVPDEFGYVNDQEFHMLIKSRGYQLVGSFEKVNKNGRIQYARIKAKYNNDGYGYINLKGEEVIKPRFLDIDHFREGLARVCIEGTKSMPYTGGGCSVAYGVKTFAFVNTKDSIITKIYSSAMPFYKGRSVVGLGAGYRNQPYGVGVIDIKGNEIVPLIYNEVRLSDDHIFARKEKLWALLNGDGKELSGFLYDSIESCNGFLLAKKDNLFLVLNPKTGQPFENAVFDYINLRDFNDFSYKNIVDMSHLVMKRGDDYFLINRKGQRISANFKYIMRLSDKLFWTKTETTQCVLNSKGKLISEADINFYGPSENGKIYTKKTGNKNTYYDKNFKEIPTAQYNWVGNYLNGLVSVGRNKKYGFINTKGKEIIPLIYDSPGNGFQHKDGAIVQLNGKWGVINRKGKTVIPFEYDYIYFSNGWYHFTINQKNGLADTAGTIIIPPAYGSVHPVYDINSVETFFVQLNSKHGIIDIDRNIVVPIVYDFMNNFYYDGMLEVRKGELYGFVDINGKEIIPCKYEYVQQFENGIALVTTSSEEKCIDRYGNELLIEQDRYLG